MEDGKKKLSVLCVIDDERCDASLTLQSLSSQLQGLREDLYDVVIINPSPGSPDPHSLTSSYGDNFQLANLDMNQKRSQTELLNFAVQTCQSEFIAFFFGCDRILGRDVLCHFVEHLKNDPASIVYTTDQRLVDRKGASQSLISFLDPNDDLATARTSFTWADQRFQTPLRISFFYGSTTEWIKSQRLFNTKFNFNAGMDLDLLLYNAEFFQRLMSQKSIDKYVLTSSYTIKSSSTGQPVSTSEPKIRALAQINRDFMKVVDRKLSFSDYLPKPTSPSGEFNPPCEIEERMKNLLARLDKKLETGNEEELIRFLQKPLPSILRESEAYLKIGQRLASAHKYELSVSILNQYLRFVPFDYYDVRVEQAILLSKMDKLSEARKQLKEVVNEIPFHRKALLQLIRICRLENDHDATYTWIKKYLEVGKPHQNQNGHFLAGVTLFKMGNYEDSLIHFYQAMFRYGPPADNLLYSTGRSLIFLNKPILGLLYVRKAMEGNSRMKKNWIVQTIIDLSIFDFQKELNAFFFKFGKELIGDEKRISKLPRFLQSRFHDGDRLAPISESVCVLGMHRSGTSCLAGCIQLAGFPSMEIFTWNKDNLQGNREDNEIQYLNQQVLGYNGVNWKTVSDKKLGWIPYFEYRRDGILMERSAVYNIWSFKDPRTVLTLPFWHHSQIRTTLVGSIRHPGKVAISLFSRNDFSLEEGLALWVAYNKKLLQYYQNCAPFPIINFDATEAEYKNQLDTVFDFLSNSKLHTEELNRDLGKSFVNKELESDLFQVDFNRLSEEFGFSELFKKAMNLYNTLNELSIQPQRSTLKSKERIHEHMRTIIAASRIKDRIKKIQRLQDLLEKNSDSVLLANMTLRFSLQENLDLTDKTLEIISDTGHHECRQFLSEYWQHRETSKALKIMTDLEKEFPQYNSIHRMHARILEEKKDYAAALNVYEQACSVQSTDIFSIKRLYSLSKRLDHVEDLRKYAKQAYLLSPFDREVIREYIDQICQNIDAVEFNSIIEDMNSNYRIAASQWRKLFRKFIHTKSKHLAIFCYLKVLELSKFKTGSKIAGKDMTLVDDYLSSANQKIEDIFQ